MAALRNFESMVEQLTRNYQTQFQMVAAPRLEDVGSLDKIYELSDKLRKVSQQGSVSHRQKKKVRQLARETEILALLAHLKIGDRSVVLAREVYLQHHNEADFLHSVDYASLDLHLENAGTNYGLAKQCFSHLQEKMPQKVVIQRQEVPVVKFRGESLRAGNYITLPQLEERIKYRDGLYHVIHDGADVEPRFTQWVDTVGEGFLEIKPYVR